MALAVACLLIPASAAAQRPQRFTYPTHSAPIQASKDSRYVYVVNPGADTVSVIRTATDTVVATVRTPDEPQSVAVDPENKYFYVASAADAGIAKYQVTRARRGTFRVRRIRIPGAERGPNGVLYTGAEPYNVVVSPDGKRVFVSNSGQDTVTVIDNERGSRGRIIGQINLRNSSCNDPDRNRHFQPRGLAVTRNSRRLLVTSFFAFTRPGGKQGDDQGRVGLVCEIGIRTTSRRIRDYRVVRPLRLAPQNTGFAIDSTGDGQPDPTFAFPNQLQSIVIHGGQAYLPNIAASPSGPLRFNVDTQAFVSVLDGVGGSPSDSATKFLNLHLGAREPEAGKKKLFFANVWGIDFVNKNAAGAAYVVSMGSDLLVKVNVAGDGDLNFTVDDNTTRYVDLADPANPATQGTNAGKNPQGIAILANGRKAYTANFISRNVSVVNTQTDQVIKVIKTANLPAAGSLEERVAVGAEIFFSSRGNFNRPAGATVSTTDRLSSEGWQSCSSCHFEGLTDSIVWTFNAGPRKSVQLNATFNPNNPDDQRVLNYSAIFDEVQDFELNIRNVSGPGNLNPPVACGGGAPNALDPAHGLLIADNGDINCAPSAINTFALPNAGRPQHTVTLPGSGTAVPALDALNEWVRRAVRTPNGPQPTARVGSGGVNPQNIEQGRQLFSQAGCTACHVGGKWTNSTKDFTSPPAAAEISTETVPPPPAGVTPIGAQYLNRFLRDIGSFNLGVQGAGNDIGGNIGAIEKTTQPLALNATTGLLTSGNASDALGKDHNLDGKGNGFNVPGLLGIDASPPYYHNGACETLACVVGNVKHRTTNGTQPDRLSNPADQAKVVEFLRSISKGTQPF